MLIKQKNLKQFMSNKNLNKNRLCLVSYLPILKNIALLKIKISLHIEN